LSKESYDEPSGVTNTEALELLEEFLEASLARGYITLDKTIDDLAPALQKAIDVLKTMT